MSREFHTPVLLKEVIDYLAVKPGGKYIDATVGGGGHAAAILKKGGLLLGIDLDEDAIKFSKYKLAAELKIKDEKYKIVQGNFSEIERIARRQGFDQVDGILFDLGVSWHQLNKAARGFSFQREARLDMRMDPVHQHVTAADLVNGLSEKELDDLLDKYGEERLARPVAAAIAKQRRVKPIKTTTELARAVVGVYRRRGLLPDLHAATRTFQALRVAVNDELGNLEVALPQAVSLIRKGGRLLVISFHSLEDRMVKNYVKAEQRLLVVTARPVQSCSTEVKLNPRARSAKLRVAERI